MAINREIRNRRGEANSLNNLGSIYNRLGKQHKAEELIQESLAIKREIGDRRGEANSLHTLGNIAYSRKNWKKAEGFYRGSVRIRNKIGSPLPEWYTEHGFEDPDGRWRFPPTKGLLSWFLALLSR